MEVYPSLAFDGLFDNHGSRRMQSLLDRVSEHASFLRRQISAADQAKLDEYLTSVREVEKRIEKTRDDKTKADQNAQKRGSIAELMPRPDNGLPEDIRDHMRLMTDLIAIAFQTDRTRVATLLLCRDLSGLFYPFLTSERLIILHRMMICPTTTNACRDITSAVANLAVKLDSMPEGQGTVLDNSCLMFISNMWSGSRHDSTKVPLLLVGGLGGTLETGRVLDYADQGDDNRKLCSLYLSLMDRMSVQLPSFGDAEERLAGL